MHEQEPLNAINSTITLLHFDSHADDDNTGDPTVHTCSPLNVYFYPEFIENILDYGYDIYHHKFEKKDLFDLYNNIKHRQMMEHWDDEI